MLETKNEKYNFLIQEIGKIISNNKKKLITSINTILVETYWHIGMYIVEYEQKGAKRAEYGKGLLKNLSKDLTGKYGKGYSVQNLELMRKFYVSFKSLDFGKSQSLIRKLSWTHIVRLLSVRNENERSKTISTY